MRPGSLPRVVRITWLGHSTVLVELDGARLLTDPVLGRRVAHLRRYHEPVDARALRPLDLVLVSHAHWDHLDVRTLARLGRDQPVVVPRGAGRILRRRGFGAVHEVEVGDRVPAGAVTVEATPAEHDASRGPFGVSAPALGYVLRGSRSVYFAGDTDVFDGMAELAGIDVALLPVSGWGPRVPAGHLDPERAARATALLRPRLVVPIHWGTYGPLHRPRPAGDPAGEYAGLARGAAPAVEVRVLQVGETVEL
jgi:L-ascorbate metabolism protein UlaG (beta-lactamase superfamily)